MHFGLRTSSSTEFWSVGSAMPFIGAMPEPIMELSVGRNRSPSALVGSRLRNTIRTGRSFVAAMIGPSHCGDVTPV